MIDTSKHPDMELLYQKTVESKKELDELYHTLLTDLEKIQETARTTNTITLNGVYLNDDYRKFVDVINSMSYAWLVLLHTCTRMYSSDQSAIYDLLISKYENFKQNMRYFIKEVTNEIERSSTLTPYMITHLNNIVNQFSRILTEDCTPCQTQIATLEAYSTTLSQLDTVVSELETAVREHPEQTQHLALLAEYIKSMSQCSADSHDTTHDPLP